ncbi:MAG: hypothetical protein ACLPUO_06685 [Streptosporangiaceae bacterium]
MPGSRLWDLGYAAHGFVRWRRALTPPRTARGCGRWPTGTAWTSGSAANCLR